MAIDRTEWLLIEQNGYLLRCLIFIEIHTVNINHITGYEYFTDRALLRVADVGATGDGVTRVFLRAKGLDPLSCCHHPTQVILRIAQKWVTIYQNGYQ